MKCRGWERQVRAPTLLLLSSCRDVLFTARLLRQMAACRAQGKGTDGLSSPQSYERELADLACFLGWNHSKNFTKASNPASSWGERRPTQISVFLVCLQRPNTRLGLVTQRRASTLPQLSGASCPSELTFLPSCICSRSGQARKHLAPHP